MEPRTQNGHFIAKGTKPKPPEPGGKGSDDLVAIEDSAVSSAEAHGPTDDLAAALDDLILGGDALQNTVAPSPKDSGSSGYTLCHAALYHQSTLLHDSSDSSSSLSDTSETEECHGSLPLTPSSSATFDDELSIPEIIRKANASTEYSNEHFQVARSNIAGWGAFARRNMVCGQIILREIPLFEAKREDVLRKFRWLSKGAQRVGLSLYGYESKPGKSAIEYIWDTNWYCFTAFRKRVKYFKTSLTA